MKKTRKVLALFLVLLMILSLTGCGGKDDTKEYAAGVVDGSTYTSEFAGITCTLGDSWTFLTQDEIAQISGIASDMTSDEKLRESLNSGSTIYEMYAMDSDSTSLNVTVGDLGAIYGKILDMKTLAESTAEEFPSAFASMGFSDVTADVTTMTFAGSEQNVILIQGSYQGVTMYERLVCMKVGNYVYSITAACYGTDRTAEVLALFQAA